MLRVSFLQQWYALAGEALQDALYDSRAMRAFVGGDVVPDATTLLKFRHRLEEHALTRQLFAGVNALLAERGAFLREGTMVDATIIAAAPSTKNKTRERDPQMHQTRKANAWHFGTKAHVGVDLDGGLVHTVLGTAANVAEVAQARALLHGEEKAALGDAGCQGVEKRPEVLRFPRFGGQAGRRVYSKNHLYAPNPSDLRRRFSPECRRSSPEQRTPPQARGRRTGDVRQLLAHLA